VLVKLGAPRLVEWVSRRLLLLHDSAYVADAVVRLKVVDSSKRLSSLSLGLRALFGGLIMHS